MQDCTPLSYADASSHKEEGLTTQQQGGSSTNEPTQAIPAAISQGVSLLLGLWASAGTINPSLPGHTEMLTFMLSR